MLQVIVEPVKLSPSVASGVASSGLNGRRRAGLPSPRVERVRRLLAEGYYDQPEVIDRCIDRVLDEVCNR
ncbi:MAG: hypothetical protein V3V20_10935 [Algisphaera sp.]